MKKDALIPHLFRTEYRKIAAVLCKLFGIEHIEIAEDITSDTFLQAAETWSIRGLPENPTAWLYTVAKNKARDLLRHNTVFNKKILPQLKSGGAVTEEWEIDLSEKNITDSQLQMLFAICHPLIPMEAQIGLALRILCGFGIDEIARAFLSNKETINKRLTRAKEKLRTEKVKIEFPGEPAIDSRLDAVLTTLYLFFNEGYYSAASDITLRKDLCFEAMRLTLLLTNNPSMAKPRAYALLSLMCFQASRLDARTGSDGQCVLYHDQDISLWNEELIRQGQTYLDLAATGTEMSKYHLEAGIAYWHTIREDSTEKWNNILQLYNHLLVIEYSPIAAMNRTFALAKARGKAEAIEQAEKLGVEKNHLYHSLLGELYTDVDRQKALAHFHNASQLAISNADKMIIQEKIARLIRG